MHSLLSRKKMEVLLDKNTKHNILFLAEESQLQLPSSEMSFSFQNAPNQLMLFGKIDTGQQETILKEEL